MKNCTLKKKHIGYVASDILLILFKDRGVGGPHVF